MTIRLALAATAALALAACSGADKPAGEATGASSPAAASSSAATPVAAPGKGDKPTKEFMIGKWGQDGDCTLAIDFKADGTTDGPFGNWALNDGVLTMADAPQKVHVVVRDDKTVESRLDGTGPVKLMTRCH